MTYDLKAVCDLIEANGGTIIGGINWSNAHFPDETKGQAVFDQVSEICEHRGFSKAQPNSDNHNLRMAGFRFR